MNIKKIPLSAPQLNGREWDYVREALESGELGPQGKHLRAFEQEIAHLCNVPHAVAMSSGSAAIHVALDLLEIGRGDQVFCSDLTFIASASPIVHRGAKPVFIDSEPDTWNMSPAALRRALEKTRPLPKAVIATDIFGASCNYSALQALCEEFSVPLVEDAAEALGSTHRGLACGSFGELGVLSFNANKLITSSGGGMLLTKNAHLAKRARFLITQAKDPSPWYQHSTPGYNYSMSNIAAAIGRAQLLNLAERIEHRRNTFDFYRQHLEPRGAVFIPRPSENTSNCWLSALYFPRRSNIAKTISLLCAAGIEARHIWHPLHRQPLFKDCPVWHHRPQESFSSLIFEKGLCLPATPHPEERHKVVETLIGLLDEGTRPTASP